MFRNAKLPSLPTKRESFHPAVSILEAFDGINLSNPKQQSVFRQILPFAVALFLLP